ncbi:hypothetical protein F1C76_21695 [Geodermatophilaceae bacterium NBWT11]|nr:hypothetical protein F1C76_21695 [Geodermatophilaceae bacterium NBWT11]
MTDEPRRRGRPPLVDRARIVAAARAIPAETLTMQVVADALGVDRKTLNYHVSDRDGLLELVAADVFAEVMARLDVARAGTWQEAVRVYADGVRAAVLQMGPLAPHFHLQHASLGATLRPVDDLIQVLLDSGFPVRTVARCLRSISSQATASGRDALREATGTGSRDPGVSASRAQVAVLRQAADDFPALRRLAAIDEPGIDPGQWGFEVDVCIAGLAQQLDAVVPVVGDDNA